MSLWLVYPLLGIFCAVLVFEDWLWDRKRRRINATATLPPEPPRKPVVVEARICTMCGAAFNRWSFIVDARCQPCQEAASVVDEEKSVDWMRKRGWADQDDADRLLKAKIEAKMAKAPTTGGIVLCEDDDDAS